MLKALIYNCRCKRSCIYSSYLNCYEKRTEVYASSVFLNKNNKVLTNNISKRSYSLVEPLKTQSGVLRILSESAPVQFLQKVLIQFHDVTGLPWWATILTSTFLLRTVITIPLAVYQQIILAKLELIKLEMNDIVKDLKREANTSFRVYKWKEEVARRVYNKSVKEHWKQLIIRENCHPFKTTLLMLVQIPLWISLSVSLRNMTFMLPDQNVYSQAIYNQLSQEGFLWIQNLNAIDCYYILPVLLSMINLLIIELQTVSKITVPTKTEKIITNVLRGISIILIPISATMPSCMVLYWTASSTFGLMQNTVLLSPKLRRFFKIPLTPSELERPYKEISLAFQQKILSKK